MSGHAFRRRMAYLEHMVAQAQFIGWPALAESFKRDIETLKAKQ